MNSTSSQRSRALGRRGYLAGARQSLTSVVPEQSGFSLPELLVVCLIIGVLVAIGIPAFGSQRAKGVDAQAKALARAAQTAAETVATDSSGRYENVTPAELNRIEPQLSIAASATHAYLSSAIGGKSEYSVTAKATDGNEFTVARSPAGVMTRECVSPVIKTGCDGAEKGSW
jgi:prepilin-type N-terminal cleavage/methylation domain-containing protein